MDGEGGLGDAGGDVIDGGEDGGVEFEDRDAAEGEEDNDVDDIGEEDDVNVGRWGE